VLEDLYAQQRDKPAPVDLQKVWNALRLSLKDGDVIFDNEAAEASIRQAITSPRP
jgi:hypothetical protein